MPAGGTGSGPITVHALLVRRAGLRRAEFRAYYDTTHRALFERVTPPDVRAGIICYVQHHAVERSSPAAESPWDCITEMSFADAGAMRRWGVWYDSDDGAVLRDDELKFMDNSKRLIVLTEPR
jgi:EthD domain